MLLKQMDKPITNIATSNIGVALLLKEIKAYEISTWPSDDADLLKKNGPLLFFKTHELEYPLLNDMAKALFSLMPASTSIKCCFSGCANIVTAKRNATSTNTLEDLTIIKSHNIFN